MAGAVIYPCVGWDIYDGCRVIHPGVVMRHICSRLLGWGISKGVFLVRVQYLGGSFILTDWEHNGD